MSTDTIRVLGISGSLRKGSFNTSLLREAVAIAEAEKLPIRFDIADIREIPPYDEDLHVAGVPEPVRKFREAIAAANAILFVTPEYNYSVPGVLKNAIDWASRPPSQPFADKPFAVMGASGGKRNDARAVPPPADRRVPRHARAQQAGGVRPQREGSLRPERHAEGRDHAPADRPAADRARRLDPTACEEMTTAYRRATTSRTGDAWLRSWLRCS